MTGPEHYREAEWLLTVGREQTLDGVTYVVDHLTPSMIAEAQAHATLALAAATAANIRRNGAVISEAGQWAAVLNK